MCMYKAPLTATALLLLLLTPITASAQVTATDSSVPQQINPPGLVEIPDSEEIRRFIEEHSFTNPSYRRKQSDWAGAEAMPSVQVAKEVRMIYLVPSDKRMRSDYQVAIANAISDLQRFYRDQVGGGFGFTLHSPIVEVYQTPHTSVFYSTGNNSGSGGFWQSVLADGFALTGGGFNDPNNRWVFYVDADTICGQVIGGNAGVALLAANDFRGLTGQPNVPACPNQGPDTFGVNRWIGGLGHELAHTWNVPHPPGCDQGSCSGGEFAANSLMWFGYARYSNTYLLDENKTQFLGSGFFSVLPDSNVISGQVTRNGSGLAGVSISLSGTQARITFTDASGNYAFLNIQEGGNFTVTPYLWNHTFNPESQILSNLKGDQIVNLTARTNTGIPILISEENSSRALALDSMLRTREPFQLKHQYQWGADSRTRIIIFATDFELAPGESFSAVTADAEDFAHRIFSLPVEYVGKVPGLNWLNYIVVKLNVDSEDVGDVLVRIKYRGISSNRVRLGIGHIGGGLPDTQGATPTPGRPLQ
jgi:hypothetical protein